MGVTFAARARNRPWLGANLGLLVGTLALLTVFSFLALSVFGDLLARMHLPGSADRGIGDIIGPGIGLDSEGLTEIMSRWATWFDSAGEKLVSSPARLLWVHLFFDSLLFVPFYVSFLAMVRMRSAMLEPGWASEKGTHVPGLPAFDGAWQWLRRLGLPVALALADVTENILVEYVIRRPLQVFKPGEDVAIAPNLSTALRWATGLKWGLLFLLILNTVPALAAGLHKVRKEGRVSALIRVLFRVRAILILVVAFGVITTLKLQVPDVFRRWNLPEGLYAGAATVLFGAISWIWSTRVAGARRKTPKDGEYRRQPTSFQLGIAVLAVGIVAAVGYRLGIRGLTVPAGALFILFLLEPLGRKDFPRIEYPPAFGIWAIPKLLAVGPLILLGIGATRAILPEAIFNHPDEAWAAPGALLSVAVLPIVLAIAMYWLLGRRWMMTLIVGNPGMVWAIRLAALAGALYIYWRVTSAVWSFSQAAGALALVGLFFAILATAFGALSLWVEVVPPPRSVCGLGFRRIPVFAFLVAWGFFGDAVYPHSPYHNARVSLRAEGPPPAVGIDQVVEDWRARNKVEEPEGREETETPMLFIAANGGGIKAATWTAFALDCVLRGGDAVKERSAHKLCDEIAPGDTNRLGQVFAMSGVSGGSFGIAEFLAEELRSRLEPEVWSQAQGAGEGWIREVMSDDFVSPTLAWQLFVEAPRALLQFSPPMDRAEVLERAWERGWADPEDKAGVGPALIETDSGVSSPLQRGFSSLWTEHHPELPLVLFNGTSVEDGCRFLVSALATDGMDPQPDDDVDTFVPGRNCTSITRLSRDLPVTQLFAATRDVRHFLSCDGEYRDIRLSTAALMSARFPWVSPSGRLPFCSTDGGAVHVVDGGYLDNSGGATIEELWEITASRIASDLIAPSCVVPYLILIDSGYGPTPEPKGEDISELTIPIKGWFSAKDSRTIEGRNDAALSFRQTLDADVKDSDRVATIYLRSQPGGEAPLGWALDETSIKALEGQLASNAEELAEIAGWFDDEPGDCPG